MAKVTARMSEGGGWVLFFVCLFFFWGGGGGRRVPLPCTILIWGRVLGLQNVGP